MARRMRRNSHVRCRAGEKAEITSNTYLSLLFGNDAEFVANSFKKELEAYYTDTFENIIFAIPGGTNYMVFKRVFGK